MTKNSDIKILLVDDREDNLLSIESVLEKDNYSFTKANSGEKALKILLKELDFTLILMDVHMPNLNGFETASLIYERERLKHIPIIFITANNDSNAFMGYQAGAVDYIYKPINPNLLRAKVSVFVELYKKTHLLEVQGKKLLEINNDLEERVRKRTEQIRKQNSELKAKNIELNKVNNDLDNFVYSASHDLKAPISNIEGLFTLLSDEPNSSTDDFKNYMSLILQSINRLKNTVHDLTEISKVQKNNNDDIETILFEEMLEDVSLDIKDDIERTNAQIHVKFDAPEIKFSKKNIRSILYNLVSNAIKYHHPDRPPIIQITTKPIKKNLCLTVSDNGLGMKPEYQHKIFEMFKRLHDHVDGSGLGLYIIKRIIENNGGKIEVQSEYNVGTTFQIYLKTS